MSIYELCKSNIEKTLDGFFGSGGLWSLKSHKIIREKIISEDPLFSSRYFDLYRAI